MFLLSFLRVIKFSFQDIGRNIWLSIVTISILILALFSIDMLLTVNFISKAAIDAIKDKIDVNIYIKPETDEKEIMALKADISGLPQIKEAQYISKAQAFEDFRLKHKNDPEVLDALKEIGKNPLTPSLIIKPKNVDQYQDLIGSLNKIESDIIESRNFDDHKLIIEKINSITKKVSDSGILISSIFIIITILLVFNSIRVAIYTHRREIKIMRLVGASNWFIRTPFIFSSLIYTIIGMIAAVSVFYFFLNLLQPYIETFFINYEINLVAYFNDNFTKIFGYQFLAAAAVNILASLMAVSKYSKV